MVPEWSLFTLLRLVYNKKNFFSLVFFINSNVFKNNNFICHIQKSMAHVGHFNSLLQRLFSRSEAINPKRQIDVECHWLHLLEEEEKERTFYKPFCSVQMICKYYYQERVEHKIIQKNTKKNYVPFSFILYYMMSKRSTIPWSHLRGILGVLS